MLLISGFGSPQTYKSCELEFLSLCGPCTDEGELRKLASNIENHDQAAP